jgi:hypothetical protein
VEDLVTNPWLNLIIGFSGIALAIIFYLKGKKIKRPIYDIKSSNVVSDIGGKFDQLELIYKNQKINNFTVSMVSFWNAGNDTIDWNDVAELDPITISIKDDYQILDAKILNTVNPTNDFSIHKIEDNIVYIKFDYIGKSQGAIFQIIHNGKSDEDLKFKGTLKNMVILKYIHKDMVDLIPLKIRKLVGNYWWQCAILFFLFLVVYMFSLVYVIHPFFITPKPAPDIIKPVLTPLIEIFTVLWDIVFLLVFIVVAHIGIGYVKYAHFVFSTSMPKKIQVFWYGLAADQPDER